MTGAPSDTWRKFRFARGAPFWAFSGDPFGGLIWGAIRDHASGHLPLTWRSSRTVALATWVPWGLVVGTLVLWIGGAIFGVDSYSSSQLVSTAWYVFFLVGSFGLAGGLLGFLVKPIICPRGRLLPEKRGEADVIELRNVHYTFVQAATQMYAERSAQFIAAEAPENLPLPPVSN
jgi:hypothetical protein